MPYAHDTPGVYIIVNHAANALYVGQSQRVNKRVREHLRLLRRGSHYNVYLQRAWDKYGDAAFLWAVEVTCEDPDDLDAIEEAFISGRGWFDVPTVYNIADFSRAPMRGKTHSPEARAKISAAKRASNFDYRAEEYRKALSDGQKARYMADPSFRAKVKILVDNPTLSYAARGRLVGTDTSSARKLALKYAHLRGVL